jgi:hypothetical protein
MSGFLLQSGHFGIILWDSGTQSDWLHLSPLTRGSGKCCVRSVGGGWSPGCPSTGWTHGERDSVLGAPLIPPDSLHPAAQTAATATATGPRLLLVEKAQVPWTSQGRSTDSPELTRGHQQLSSWLQCKGSMHSYRSCPANSGVWFFSQPET